MPAAAVAALIAALVLVAPSLLILIFALVALLPRRIAMSSRHAPADTNAPEHVAKADLPATEGKAHWLRSDKEAEKGSEGATDKESKQYAGEQRSSARTESTEPERYVVQHTGVATDEHPVIVLRREQKEVDAPEELASSTYETDDTFYATMCRKKADNFAIMGKPEEMPIWVCTKKDRVVDVLKGLIERNILSVPVLLENGKWYGFLDMMDIVRYVVRHLGPASKLGEQHDFWKLVKEEREWELRTVDELMQWPASTHQAFVPVISGYSAYAVMETMARERGLRRVPVITNRTERKLLNLVTQSQCVRWLAKHTSLLGQKKNKPVALCSHFFKEVVSVKEDAQAIEAFETMVDKNIQGVAVVNKDGKLVGNLSIRDLKLIGHDMAMFWRLQQTVKNFLEKVRHEYAAKHPGVRHRHAMYVLPKATVRDVVMTLNDHDIHRVYVCNNHADRKPIGVISLRDVLLECIGV